MAGAIVLLVALICCLLCYSQATVLEDLKKRYTAVELGKYSISDVTVSGVSSGAYFAVQFHMSHSSFVNGSATFAGGPFYCAESSVTVAENRCMDVTLGPPQVDLLVATARDDFLLGLIDNPANLMDDRIYMFSGSMDTVVDPTVVHSLYKFYEAFTKTSNIVADFNIPAEHCIPTLNFGEECSTLSTPYIGKCNFDGAGSGLKVLFGNNLNSPVNAKPNNLFMFDQKPFLPAHDISIGDAGFIYVPTSCQSGTTKCHLHLSFHGCLQNLELIGDEYAANAGFNEWAEANNIIVLYPYAKVSKVEPYNPNGCWDWWAYTGVNYGVKTGFQTTFVKKIIDHIRGLAKN